MSKNNRATTVVVNPDTFKFSSGHFVAYPGFRETLHGHNYTVSVSMRGAVLHEKDSYVLDFGVIKDNTRKMCKDLSEKMMIPCCAEEHILKITRTEKNLKLRTEDGDTFSIPARDCILLPIKRTTCEELATWFWDELFQRLGGIKFFRGERSIDWMGIEVKESPTQGAMEERLIDDVPEGDFGLNTKITLNDIPFEGCAADETPSSVCESDQSAELAGRVPLDVAKTSVKPGLTDDSINALYPTKMAFGKAVEEESPQDEAATIAAHMEAIIRCRLKLRPGEALPAGMQETPMRSAKAMLEQTRGMDQDEAYIEENFMKVFVEELRGESLPEPVSMHNIPFTSLCEHHFLAFNGEVSIEYVPGLEAGVDASQPSKTHKRILGLSKLARVVDAVARRFQVQERFTEQVVCALSESQKLRPAGVAVRVRAEHGCMQCRGVCVPTGACFTVTKAYRGVYAGTSSEASQRQQRFEQACAVAPR
eukprot:TRINITY_DN23574_c0_g1_i1.p1 TRINITY_DN23574_c0_g1~~TRINITY_DN23574_c0_g1_i1.p1  ORF type:complete len:479 (+),score=78.04 TRINITY_DN23574_c0_g1_i1:204-1640(+)